jgi:acyl-CoA synthetase (NDP forming)
VDPDLYRRTLPPILEDDRFGSVVLGIILTDPKTIRLKLPPITSALRGLRPRKPVIFAALDEGAPFDFPELDQLRELGVACFPSTERALRALALVTKRAQLVSGPVRGNEEPIQPLSLRTGLLSEVESKEILARIGIAVPEGTLATTLHEAVSIAAEIGYPVAIKAQSANLPHKSDVGGVLLGIATEADLQEAWSTLHHSVQIARPEIVLDGALVERMGTKGVELIVGARRDPQWGPVLMVGFGGVLAEAIQDFQLMAPNSSRESIREKLNQLRCSPLLRGFRGAPAADVNATITVLEKVGLLMQSCSEISEIDINPLAVYPDGKGAFALDALISVVDKVR